MARGGSRVTVLDTWAMLAYLDGEPAGREVRQLLRRARRRLVVALFSLINFGEVVYVIEREQGLQQAQRAIALIDQLAVQIVPADRTLVFEAAHVKARYAIAYADSFSVALAKRTRGCVMTGDPEFEAVEGEVVIRWLADRRRR